MGHHSMKRGLPEKRGNDKLWRDQVNLIFRQSSKCINQGTLNLKKVTFYTGSGLLLLLSDITTID